MIDVGTEEKTYFVSQGAEVFESVVFNTNMIFK